MLLGKVPARLRPRNAETWPLVAGVFVLCAFIALSVKALKVRIQTCGLASQSSCNIEIRNILQESQPVQLLEDAEIIPLQNIELTDGLDLARSPRYRTQALSNDLPAERWYETDGVAPAVGSRCPVQFPSHITRTG